MILLYARYVFIFWLLIGSNHGDLMLMRQLSEDNILLNISACTKECLQTKNEKSLLDCYEYCKSENSTNTSSRVIHKIQENFLLKLVCRTESKLTFRINWIQHSRKNSTQAIQSAPDVMFIIKINADKDMINESLLYLSDDSFFTLPDLEPNTTHTITALAVHSDGAYSLISIEEAFMTLRRGYQPSKMGAVKVKRYHSQPNDWERLAVEVEWEPSAERNCFFDMLYYSTSSETMETKTPVEFRDPRLLYTYIIPNITFEERISVGLRTVNDKNLLESPFKWLELTAPSCLNWVRYNYTLCAPLSPRNLKVDQHHFVQNVLTLNISWSLPKYPPDYYKLYILDLHDKGKKEEFLIDGNASSYYIANITILGKSFEVHLSAHTRGGQKIAVDFPDKVPLETWMQDVSMIKLMLFLFVPICCIFVLCTLQRNRRQQCNHLEVKTMKGAPNQSSDFHVSLVNSSLGLATLAAEDNFELEDELEVEPHAVLLQDVLGEGAFGLVRRGVYKQRQVAVKLLKDQPNEEDIQAFRCEIQMLKAVGRHPNIVGIVGYSTRFSNRMMLLTEYCGLGSLQSFLRDEWKFRQERSAQAMQPKLRPEMFSKKQPQQHLRHLLEQDARIEDINSSILSTLDEDTESELSRISDQLGNNKLSKFILAADNKSYGLQDIENIDGNPPPAACLKAILRDREQPVKSCVVSFENQEYFNSPTSDYQVESTRQPLRYADLLDIAHQVAVGMDFLAQNRIVHRDLAARNVLISLDRTIKIADFGLSRDVYHENVYRKSGGSGKLPIKWLALESLTHQVYTSQSDVWSFGVLLYEITTLGGMPYPSISPRDLLQLLRQGQRMKQPEECTDEMFALMECCWCSIPANRPTFAELKQRLDAMILATNELPERLKRQKLNNNLQLANNMEQPSNLHSQVEQLNQDVSYYLQPLN